MFFTHVGIGGASYYLRVFQVSSALTPGCLKRSEITWCLGRPRLIGENLGNLSHNRSKEEDVLSAPRTASLPSRSPWEATPGEPSSHCSYPSLLPAQVGERLVWIIPLLHMGYCPKPEP